MRRKKLANDLGVGLSTLNKWIKTYCDTGTVPQNEAELVKEIERLRRELRIVTEEKEVFKKAAVFLAGQRGRERQRPNDEVCVHRGYDELRCPGRACVGCSGFPSAACAPAEVSPARQRRRGEWCFWRIFASKAA